MNDNRASEKGQALILLVLAFIVLLGFVALAIDGGMVYADRRHSQNAADASSLAGGGAAALSLENNYVDYEDWNCSNPGNNVYAKIQDAMAYARSAAISQAATNDFTIDTDITDNNGVVTHCGAFNTGTWVDKYIDITTTITTDTRTNFVHLLYPGPLRNTVRAVVRIRPQIPMTLGFAVVALRNDCPNTNTGGVHFDGNNTVVVNGGGVFSNACLVAGGSVDVQVNDAGLACTGQNCYTQNGSPSVHPAPTQGSTGLQSFTYPASPPDCATAPARGNHSGGGTIEPGSYGRIRVNNAGAQLVMRSGLYCINDEFTMNGGSVTVEPRPNGDEGVTIYMVNGPFTVNGNVHVELKGPPTDRSPHPCNENTYCPPAIAGMLIYSAPGNTSDVTITGDATSTYLGTIFAPDGTIEAGGDAIEQINAQLIGDTVFIHGNTQVFVNFDNAVNFRPPAQLELYR